MRTKTFLTAVLLWFGSMSLTAQGPAEKLFEKYSGREGFTSVIITQNMFELFADIEAGEEDEFINLAKSLNMIRILAEDEETESPEGINFYSELMAEFPGNAYEELMIVRKKDQDVRFYVRKEKDKIRELVMIAGGEDDNALIIIDGDIDLKTISNLSKSMQIRGMENLEELEEGNK
ncbi:MAG: DUF4252 domain-containing protein [Bacteroidales bacterium]|nr:DUF4252 domain-containing protein [Bacteroidales bacterium]